MTLRGLSSFKLAFGHPLVLAFDARPSTKDLDAIFAPAPEMRAAALKVAAKREWPDGWLNDGVKGFLRNLPPEETPLLSLSHLTEPMPITE